MISNSVLWQLSFPGQPESYLFGTMHVQDNIAYTHWDKALKALYKCSHFNTEIDLNQAQSTISQQDYQMSDQQSLRELVTDKHYAKMEHILKKAFNFHLPDWDRYLPLIITNRIAETLLSADNAKSLDGQLWAEAQRMQMACGGLETVEEQLNLLKSLDLHQQVKMLRDLCKDVSKFKKQITKTTALYQDQKIHELYRITKKSLGQFRAALLYQRNQLMADRIADKLASPTFYAMGAAHLAGRYGVLPLLKYKGIKVVPIN